MDQMRTCKNCRESKPMDAFGLQKRPSGKMTVRHECKACCLAQLNAYKKSDAGKEKHKAMMRRYMAERKLLADAALAAIKAGIIPDPRIKP